MLKTPKKIDFRKKNTQKGETTKENKGKNPKLQEKDRGNY